MSDQLLFVYGTLLPGQERWSFLEQFVAGEGTPDTVAGALYDTGEGYPAATFTAIASLEVPGASGSLATPSASAPDSPPVVGQVFELDAARLDEALAVLDEVEDAVLGLYRRVRVLTASGREVWAYQHGAGLTLIPIVSGDWLAHTAVPVTDRPAQRNDP